MKNRHNRAQTQCPSCGAWNDSNASMCTGCGRILQLFHFGGIYNSLYMMHKGRLQIRIMKRRQMS